MLLQFGHVFLNVIAPVFVILTVGYFVGPRLGLEARTLSRIAYFVLIPAFNFGVMVDIDIQAAMAIRMVAFATAVHVALAILAVLTARLLRKPPEVAAAFVIIAVFGNVGNFGFPLIEFRFGLHGIPPATVYFTTIAVVAFVISVAAAGWQRGGGGTAVLSVLKTPALIALVPALILNALEVHPPLIVTRVTDILGRGMIPVMILALGVQLATTQRFRMDRDVLTATAIRLLGGPLVAFFLAVPFALEGLARSTGIAQCSMPVAILASIVALEYDLLPDFVTRAVIFSTIASVPTLTVVLALL